MITLTHLAISGLMTGLILGTADPVVLTMGSIAYLQYTQVIGNINYKDPVKI